MRLVHVQTWEEWRSAARELLQEGTPPAEVSWQEGAAQETLLGLFDTQPAAKRISTITVPKAFLELARNAACFRAPDRWALLYRLLWRLNHGERDVLGNDADDDVLQLRRRDRAVHRDIHKMHAFVRFRQVRDEDGTERYIAWHRPDHEIVELAVPFFVRRFGAMRWAILTPDKSAYWDLEQLHFGPGVLQHEAPAEDGYEPLWRTYYASIFNPARLKLRAMRQEMAVRHWATLPEAQLIPSLVRESQGRVEQMVASAPPSARPFVPATVELPVLRDAARACQGCGLYRCATGTVFGEGVIDAAVMLVGEQPGDQEDLQGRPFVGPAGQLLDRALAEAGLPRERLYVTNAVKHFKFQQEGKRRIHQKPNGGEVSACRPWLEAEFAAVRPQRIVCLGATAALAVLGRQVAINKERGRWLPHRTGAQVLVTMHPSAILRMPDPDQADAAYAELVDDLRLAGTLS